MLIVWWCSLNTDIKNIVCSGQTQTDPKPQKTYYRCFMGRVVFFISESCTESNLFVPLNGIFCRQNLQTLFLMFIHFVKLVCSGLSSAGFILSCAAWCGLPGCVTLAPLWRRHTLSAHSLGHDWSWDFPPGILFTLFLSLSSSHLSDSLFFPSKPFLMNSKEGKKKKKKKRLSSPPPSSAFSFPTSPTHHLSLPRPIYLSIYLPKSPSIPSP